MIKGVADLEVRSFTTWTTLSSSDEVHCCGKGKSPSLDPMRVAELRLFVKLKIQV